VVFPEGQPAPQISELAAPEFCASVEYHTCPVYPNDYIGQQISKLRAWEWSDADVIGYLDSDMVFARPFYADALPAASMGACLDVIGARPWSEAGTAEDAWRQSTRALLGFEPTHETMCRHPFVHRRDAIRGCYEHVGGEPALLAAGMFSEFNLLGNYAISRGASAVPTQGPELQRQFRSYDGITLETREWLALNGYADHVDRDSLENSAGFWTIANDTHVSRWARESGRLDHDQNALPRILDVFRGKRVVWDIGAFIGDHTRAYADAGHRVVAIEPRPDAFECLARNFAGDPAVTCICLAVGNRECATLAADDANKGARHLQRVDAGHETATIDDLTRVYPMPDAVKLDVEGWEVKALQGAAALLASVRPVLVVEVNRGALERAGDSPAALHAILTTCGYRMRDLYTGEPWRADDPREQFDVAAEAS
jgi:FkbM family methyltransferase